MIQLVGYHKSKQVRPGDPQVIITTTIHSGAVEVDQSGTHGQDMIGYLGLMVTSVVTLPEEFHIRGLTLRERAT